MKKIVILLAVVVLAISIIAITGCATTSRLVDLKGQPPVTDLFPDEEDIATVIEEIKEKPMSNGGANSGAVTWNGTGYLVTPEVWEKVLNDKIYLMALKKKVKVFAETYDPETLKDAWRKDLGTSILTILLILGIAVY